MNKRILGLVLFIVALLAIGYAVYRSPAETITVTEIGRETVYGSSPHGLTTGLGVFAGLCVIGAVLLFIEEGRNRVPDQRSITKKAADRLATNYPTS
jgi:hypothetical protein